MNTKNSTLGRGLKLWWSNLPRVIGIAAATWIPVYALAAALGVGLDVPGRMATVIRAVGSGHSPSTVAVSALAT
jgi:hypothetical protein